MLFIDDTIVALHVARRKKKKIKPRRTHLGNASHASCAALLEGRGTGDVSTVFPCSVGSGLYETQNKNQTGRLADGITVKHKLPSAFCFVLFQVLQSIQNSIYLYQLTFV